MQNIHQTADIDRLSDLKLTIVQSMDQPQQLELLYRKNKSDFQNAFNAVYENIQGNPVARTWYERLHFKQDEISWGKQYELLFLGALVFLAGCVAKLPDWFTLNKELFFTRNIGFIVFPFLIGYFAWKQQAALKTLIFPILSIVVTAVYVNSLPPTLKSDAIIQATIHLPIFLWTVFGYVFLNGNLLKGDHRIQFLRFNGELVVMSAIVFLSSMLFTLLTMGLFRLIGIHLEQAFEKYFAVWGAPAIPLVSAFLVVNNPQLVGKISPVIAKIFTPFVFVTLFLFLAAIVFTGNYPYNNRDFLLIFNALLIAVLAIILFSVSEATKQQQHQWQLVFLLGLSILTVIANGIALSAIAFRIHEFGITPNRVAVLGGDILILGNLLLVAHKLFLILRGKVNIAKVEQSLAAFLPVYCIWAGLVTFLLPFIFKYK